MILGVELKETTKTQKYYENKLSSYLRAYMVFFSHKSRIYYTTEISEEPLELMTWTEHARHGSNERTTLSTSIGFSPSATGVPIRAFSAGPT
jgi:hypothetical protein